MANYYSTSPHYYEQRPVNFRDQESDYNDPYADTRTRTAEASSMNTYQTSGILAVDPSDRRDEYGHTEAEIVAFSYRSTPLSPESPTSSAKLAHENPVTRQPSTTHSQHRKSYAASNADALTYIDEDFKYYSSRQTPQSPVTGKNDGAPLVQNAAAMGRETPGGTRGVGELEYQDPYRSAENDGAPANRSAFARLVAMGRYPLEQRIEDKKRGIGRQKYPFVVWALTVTMVAVFIYELVVNAREQGTPISFKPVVNPMLGPSGSALINVGARFPPCMKVVKEVPATLQLPCMNDTANPPDRLCPISELCGFGGLKGKDPNQSFRFFTPIFLHAGIIHLALNMIAQMLVSAQVEREMGSAGFLILYFAAGIFGNILGGNFALVGVPSVGASGAIFGTIAVSWVDLFAHWKYQYRPRSKLIFMTIELIIGVAIGFIPYVDNFAHIGGFLMGLLTAIVLYPVISPTRRRKLIMYSIRIAVLPLIIVLFVVLTRNFYTSDPYAACSGCRYLSCIPTGANNYCKGTGITTTTVPNIGGGTNPRRSML